MDQNAARAIEESIFRNRIVTISYDATVEEDLLALCDDSADNAGVTEYWGTTPDGHTWCVNLARE